MTHNNIHDNVWVYTLCVVNEIPDEFYIATWTTVKERPGLEATSPDCSGISKERGVVSSHGDKVHRSAK